MVFQDPFASINPVFRVSHGIMRSAEAAPPGADRPAAHERGAAGLRGGRAGPAPPRCLQRYPHELSGGQRQRVGFAQALAMRPKLILADEPVSMLDVSIRIGLLNLMADAARHEGVSILYITHDIASARYVADRLIVMYAGHIAEAGPDRGGAGRPRHPYTQLLLSAVPDPRAALSVTAETDQGEPPRVIDPAPGCRFRWRCPLAIDECRSVTPELARCCCPATRPPAMWPRPMSALTSVRMKLAVVGGGSTYTPELVDGLARLPGDIEVDRAGPGRPGRDAAVAGRPVLRPDHARRTGIPARLAGPTRPGRRPRRRRRGAAPAAGRRPGGAAPGRDLAA